MPNAHDLGVARLQAFEEARRVIFGAIIHGNNPGDIRRQPFNYLLDVRGYVVTGDNNCDVCRRIERLVRMFHILIVYQELVRKFPCGKIKAFCFFKKKILATNRLVASDPKKDPFF
jgi:hypothetical protein